VRKGEESGTNGDRGTTEEGEAIGERVSEEGGAKLNEEGVTNKESGTNDGGINEEDEIIVMQARFVH
jgi:hypothetical protein